MRITYDEDADAMYIRLVEGHQECRTLVLTDQIALDLGPNDMLVGIEILDAKELLGNGRPPALVLKNVAVASD